MKWYRVSWREMVEVTETFRVENEEEAIEAAKLSDYKFVKELIPVDNTFELDSVEEIK